MSGVTGKLENVQKYVVEEYEPTQDQLKYLKLMVETNVQDPPTPLRNATFNLAQVRSGNCEIFIEP